MADRDGAGKRRSPWHDVGIYSGIGFAFAVFVFGGFFLGRWLDGLIGTGPWLALIGFFAGFLCAIYELVIALKRSGK